MARYKAIDADQLTDQQADELVEQAAEAADGRGGGHGAAFVIDTESDEGEGSLIAFIPGDGGIFDSAALADSIAERLNRP